MKSLASPLGVGIVAIGCNEGDRLDHRLRPESKRVACIVYVDSGSMDGSVARLTSAAGQPPPKRNVDAATRPTSNNPVISASSNSWASKCPVSAAESPSVPSFSRIAVRASSSWVPWRTTSGLASARQCCSLGSSST